MIEGHCVSTAGVLDCDRLVFKCTRDRVGDGCWVIRCRSLFNVVADPTFKNISGL